MTFHSWQNAGTPAAPYTTASPNMLALRDHLLEVWGGQFLGCYNPRPIRGGQAWSSHAFGAAIDWGYGERHDGPGRTATLEQVVPWLIDNHALLGVQAIHDYGGRRYWRSHVGWVMRPPGQGLSDSLHIETTLEAWADKTPVTDRKVGSAAAPPKAKDLNKPARTLKRGSTGAEVKKLQTTLATLGFYLLAVDGKYGPRTQEAVKAYQAANGLEVDGLAGPKTQAKIYG